MDRLFQTILIGTFLPFCWLAMQAVHELGHVIGAYATGGGVAAVNLHPLIISSTVVQPNPHPVLVVWAGPVIGTLVTLVLFAVASLAKLSSAYLFRFFAGFCLVANGAYIGVGPFYPAGDTDSLALFDVPAWQMYLFGLVTVPCGFWLWNHLGLKFGLGEARGSVNRTHAVVSLALLIIVVVAELATG